MTLSIDRRSLLLTATLGSAALAIPGFAQTSTLLSARGFTHAVASGEPGPDSMLFWTRYVPADGGAVTVGLEVSETPDFRKLAGGGRAATGPWRDFTAKVTVDGLKPGTRYFYRFVAPDGTRSPLGRTKTLPDRDVRSFRAAVFSCSNFSFGYFNAYGHAAAQDDIDLAIHLGDYLYEYKVGAFPALADVVGGRIPQPANELVALADYRFRYASYRADPDLIALHQTKPWIVSQDDHESANNSWEGGAEHQLPGEGDWNARKAAALQAWHEWLPVDDEPYRTYDIGSLATFFRTESRLLARTRQAELPMTGGDAALIAFRDGPWQDPAATMLGGAQESWLAQAFRDSVRRGQRWQVAGVGTVMGDTRVPPQATGWLTPNPLPKYVRRIGRGVAATRLGIAAEMDNWGGYPAARARFLRAAQAADANLIVLSGDSHNAWNYDLPQDGRAAGVEFAGHSVTSPGYEAAFAVDPKTVAAGLVAASPQLKWCDTGRRGYMQLTLMPDRAINDWVFSQTVGARTLATGPGHRATVERGRNRIA